MSEQTTTIAGILEERRQGWPSGACSKVLYIKDYSGVCGRCGWSVEDHEYLMDAMGAEEDING